MTVMTGRWLVVLLLLSALGACGFHLRGAVSLPPVMERTLITGTDNSPLYYELESALLAAGAQVVDDEEAATATLAIHSERSGRRVLSVDSQGRASEYELSLRLVFSLVAQGGRVIADRQELQLLRDYSFDPDNVLGSGGQEALLQTELRRYAARQILRRVQSLARQPASVPTERVPAAPAQAQ
jgi:LPS-assembly lipoprotein